MQHKARDMENSRADAIRERDEYKRLLHEKGRKDSLMRSRVVANISETLVHMKQGNLKVEGTCLYFIFRGYISIA